MSNADHATASAPASAPEAATFREPTELALSSNGAVDAMPVFHGTNGAEKSNVLAAIDQFFRLASLWLSSNASRLGEEFKLP